MASAADFFIHTRLTPSKNSGTMNELMAPHLAATMKEILRKRSVIRSGRMPVVVLPLEQWEQIEDIIHELASPKLLKSIAVGRTAKNAGRAVSYRSVRRSLGLT